MPRSRDRSRPSARSKAGAAQPSVSQFLRDCIALLGDGSSASTDSHALGAIVLDPHQVIGARRLRHIIDVHGGALLADEVGLGKTFTALEVARDWPSVLIVAPAALCSMWRAAIDQCGIAADIVSYERLSARRFETQPRWTLVMLDEAHHARTPVTRRYRALESITRGAAVLLITATPVHNRPRDLRALFALFLGAGASTLDDAALSALIVRRCVDDVQRAIPTLAPLVRHTLPGADPILEALRNLPPPLPPADGGVAQALVALQLTRAWCSSDAALVAAIRRRLVTALALEQSLECGRLPSQRELAGWTAGDDASVQLAFPLLMASPARRDDVGDALRVVRAHAAALRAVRALLHGPAGRDGARFDILRQILDAHGGRQVVVFTHSAETAEAAFRALRHSARVALLTGRGAALSSGPIPRREILQQFAPDTDATGREAGEVTRIDVLVASDVVSEGIDLQRASLVVHLDLPWTVARLEQRMGRVRRIGSRHASVAAHLIAPPADAQELTATLQHLTRKATLANAMMGGSSVLGDAWQWADLLEGAPGSAPALVRDRIRDRLQRLMTIAQRSAEFDCPTPMADATGPNVAPAANCGLPGSALDPSSPSVLRWTVLPRLPPRSIALVSIEGNAHVVVATTHAGVSHDPVVVLSILDETLADLAAEEMPAPHPRDRRSRERSIARSALARAPDRTGEQRAGGAGAAPGKERSDCTTAADLERQLHDWCRSRSAIAQLTPPPARNSPSHRRLLHALDALPSRAPRAKRGQLAAAVTQAREHVLQQHGAGAERVLDALADSCPESGTMEGPSADRLDRWLQEVLRALRPTSDGQGIAPPPIASTAAIVSAGMLTLLRHRYGG